jgi:4-hydroxy-2-oxoheptanedioate aldolase
MIYGEPIVRAWSQGRPAYGVLARIGAPLAVEFVAGAGLDYVCMDLRHGLGGVDSLAGEIAACWSGGAVPLVRTPDDNPWHIGKSLDLGAAGVIVSQVASAEQAAKAVAATRYPPRGSRSYGPIRTNGATEAPDLREGPMCFVMIETLQGLRDVEAIADTPELTGIYVGVTNLALSMGLAPRGYGSNPDHAEAVQRVGAACAEAGIVAGMQCRGGREAADWAARGFRLITIGSDLTLLRGTVARELAAAGGCAA